MFEPQHGPHAGKAASAEPGQAGASPAKFYRGLDGRIHFTGLSMPERLRRLSKDSWAVIRPAAVLFSVPCSLLLLYLGVFLVISASSGGIPILSSLAAPVGAQQTLALLVMVCYLSAAILTPYLVLSSLLTSAFRGHYLTALRYLVHTDLALLIAEEQYWLRIFEQTRNRPPLSWGGSPLPKRFEDHLTLAASYCRVLKQYMLGSEQASLPQLSHGACAWWVGTPTARTVSVVSILFCCCVPYATGLGCLAVPVWIVGLLHFIERSATLAAICDFFVGELAVSDEDIRPPRHRSRSSASS